MAKKLTIKQEKFCDKYIECGNASEAYRFAYSCSRMKPESVNNKSYELLTKVEIRSRVSELQKESRAQTEVTRERILAEHSKIAFSSIAHLHKTWIERVEFEELTADQKASIKSIATKLEKRKNAFGDFVDVEFVKIELYDKQKALDSLTKMLGYDAPTQIEVKGREPLIVEVIDNRRQVANEDTDQ